MRGNPFYTNPRTGRYGSYIHADPGQEHINLEREIKELEAQLASNAGPPKIMTRILQQLSNARQKFRMLKRDNYIEP